MIPSLPLGRAIVPVNDDVVGSKHLLVMQNVLIETDVTATLRSRSPVKIRRGGIGRGPRFDRRAAAREVIVVADEVDEERVDANQVRDLACRNPLVHQGVVVDDIVLDEGSRRHGADVDPKITSVLLSTVLLTTLVFVGFQ